MGRALQWCGLSSPARVLLSSCLKNCSRSPSPLPWPKACLYALLAYNTCLGQAITEAEEAREDKAAEAAQHEQASDGESCTRPAIHGCTQPLLALQAAQQPLCSRAGAGAVRAARLGPLHS